MKSGDSRRTPYASAPLEIKSFFDCALMALANFALNRQRSWRRANRENNNPSISGAYDSR
jgi:hypothetical protein